MGDRCARMKVHGRQVGTQLVDTMNHFREAEVVREASHMG